MNAAISIHLSACFQKWLLVVVLIGCVWPPICAAPSPTGESRKKNYSLISEDASIALRKFVEQSGEQVIYLENQIRGVKTNAVHGTYSAREAIELLVSETVLMFVEDKETGALMIQRREPHKTPSPETPECGSS